ncbi:MAG: beta-propeller fold lactonase family protein, partial [Bacilli bacterium]|nr:beta-propeller fold lactonase family protein [Bacilli bacterium]
MKLVISGYTVNLDDKLNHGLCLYDVNDNVTLLDSVNLNSPSFVCKDKFNHIFTYTKEPLQMVVYEISNDKFKLLDQIDLSIETLTHLYFDNNTNRLYGASYKDGAYMYVDFINNQFTNLHIYKSPYPSKCHCVFPIESKQIGIVDIENDNLDIYDLDMHKLKTLQMPKGIGPRHALYKDNKIYFITEYSNEIYIINCNTGKILDVHSTLTTDVKSFGSTLFFDNNGYLYASNRGEETITIFDVTKDKNT